MNQYRREGRNRPDDPTTAGEWVMTHSSTSRECIPLSRTKPASESICGLHSHAHFRAGSCPELDDHVKGDLECAFGRTAPPSPVGGSGSRLFQFTIRAFLSNRPSRYSKCTYCGTGRPGNLVREANRGISRKVHRDFPGLRDRHHGGKSAGSGGLGGLPPLRGPPPVEWR